MKPLKPLNQIILYAYIGEDELGSGRVGLKQGSVPAGIVPLAAMDFDLPKLKRLLPQAEEQAATWGMKIYLIKFVAVEVVLETEAGL